MKLLCLLKHIRGFLCQIEILGYLIESIYDFIELSNIIMHKALHPV
jgi:hypothetical protein